MSEKTLETETAFQFAPRISISSMFAFFPNGNNYVQKFQIFALYFYINFETEDITLCVL